MVFNHQRSELGSSRPNPLRSAPWGSSRGVVLWPAGLLEAYLREDSKHRMTASNICPLHPKNEGQGQCRKRRAWFQSESGLFAQLGKNRDALR